jgi:di/tricarboxylate transporter
MTQDQILLFTLFGGVFALLLWGRFRYDMVAFGALLLAVVLGLVPAEAAFAGFGHPAVVVVALGPRDLGRAGALGRGSC